MWRLQISLYRTATTVRSVIFQSSSYITQTHILFWLFLFFFLQKLYRDKWNSGDTCSVTLLCVHEWWTGRNVRLLPTCTQQHRFHPFMCMWYIWTLESILSNVCLSRMWFTSGLWCILSATIWLCISIFYNLHCTAYFSNLNLVHWVAVRCEASGASKATPIVVEAPEQATCWLYLASFT